MPLTRKPIEVPAWHLADQSDMLTALADLAVDGWRGAISRNPDGSWRIELNADNPTRQVIAATGDWIVDDFGLRTLTAAQVADHYDESD